MSNSIHLAPLMFSIYEAFSKITCNHDLFKIQNRVMDEWADKDGKKTSLAKSLIGEKVRTTVWKPETFSSLNWFRNIFKVEE